MSGITALIDTLLHQVLGKRVDLPPPRDINAPVKAIDPGRGPHAVRSDSRLDARHATIVGRHERHGSAASPSSATGTPSSTITRLSAPAQHIADLLRHFPAPPSAMAARQPLLSAPPAVLSLSLASNSAMAQLRPGNIGEESSRPVAGQIALGLANQIRDSGLFFESHLARWIKGEIPHEQLAREPQVWRVLRFRPVIANPSGKPRGLAPAPWRARQPAGFVPHDSPLTVPPGVQDSIHWQPPSAEQNQPVIHDSLALLVRQQLELLSTPILRWEGDVWSGLFMAMLLQPDLRQQNDRRPATGHHQQNPSRHSAWQAQLRLDVDDFGPLCVDIRLQQAQLLLSLASHDHQVRERLQQHQQLLATRLRRQGLQQIEIRVVAAISTAQDIRSHG